MNFEKYDLNIQLSLMSYNIFARASALSKIEEKLCFEKNKISLHLSVKFSLQNLL